MNFIQYRLTSIFFPLLLLAAQQIRAAPGELADRPLFLGTSVAPNILFLVDDSGSMDWEVLLSKGAEKIYGSGAANWRYLKFSPQSNQEARELCLGYNVMAYDASKTYTPWRGKSKNGTTYKDMSILNAYGDPYHESGTSNLSGHFYIKWDDKNANKIYENGECDLTGAVGSGSSSSSSLWRIRKQTSNFSKTYSISGNTTIKVYIGSDNPSQFESSGGAKDYFNLYYSVDGGPKQTIIERNGAMPDRVETLNVTGSSITFTGNGKTTANNESYYLYSIDIGGTSSCPACVYVTDMGAAEQTNYANWYTYYRSREFVAKRALSEIIADGRSRMGLASLHNNESVGTLVKDINDISGTDPAAATNKATLLKNLSKIRSSGGTPLRNTLKEAGQYFHTGKSPGSGLFGTNPTPSSPILSAADGGACQQNFAIMMSDGYWNGGSPSVGNTDGGTSNSAFDGASYADSHSNTLADVAMKYYETDLAPGLSDNVPVTSGIDNNSAQHMVSFTVAFGVNGSLSSDPPNRVDPFTWPSPYGGDIYKIDDMRHAAWNGRGEFLSAADPQELIDSLNTSISSIQDRVGSASAVAFNTTSITSDTFVYQARFDSGNWSGQLYAFEFGDAGVGNIAWEASDILSEPSKTNWQNRNIFTYRSDTSKGVPFVFPSDYKQRLDSMPDDGALNEIQIRDLLTNAPYSLSTTDAAEIAANQAFGVQIVNYLSGDYSEDGATFRNRHNKRLADIVHSSPEFIGKPAGLYPNYLETTSYFDFVTNNSSRTPVVYVGTNGGMLHAFHAQNGKELFSYIPGTLFAEGNRGLHKLTEHNYSHLPYIDGSPTSRDVFVNGSWKTYLAGGFRAGGKSVYVLDVTDPSKYSSATEAAANQLAVLEFTHNDLGYTFSNPQITKLNNGKWAAIFGNGYNNDPNGDGSAKLFLLYLDGSGYQLLDTKAGFMVSNDCDDAASDCNGLSSPSLIDTNSDFIVDRIYAGDLQGNMWVFDVSATNPISWKPAFGTISSPKPLFTACTGAPCTASGKAANRQPITTKPVTVPHPSVSNSSTFPNVMVLFGTGQYLAESDNTDKSLQSFYGVWDAGNSYDELDRDDLVEQTLSYPGNSELITGRKLSTEEVTYSTLSTPMVMGWYIDLKEPDGTLIGERITVDPLSTSEYVFFNTTIPNDAVCSAGGSGFLMVADIRTGGQPQEKVFESYNFGNTKESLENAYAGIPLGAIPGGSTIINNNNIVVSDSLGRIIKAEFNPVIVDKNSRRSGWSILR